MYNPSGSSASTTHKASALDKDGSAWSLSRITTPLGSTIDISYERDAYSTISGQTILETPVVCGAPASGYYPDQNLLWNLTVGSLNPFHQGDVLRIDGNVSYTCVISPPPNYTPQNFSTSVHYSGDYTVQSTGSTTVNLGSNFRNITGCNTSQPMSIDSEVGTIQRIITNKKGGDIRVASIVLRDQNQTYKTRYLYSNDDGTPSGVVAQEPGYVKSSPYDYDGIPGYPMTPVLYSKVTVLSGKLSTDADYNTKAVYEFETPNLNMVVQNADKIQFDADVLTNYHVRSLKNEISDYTSKIGAFKSLKTYDQSNNLISTTSSIYTSQLLNPGGVNNYQGYFSSGTLMFERMDGSTTPTGFEKTNRTTQIKYPYTLQSIVTQKDGFTTETDNIAWDFISGEVVEKNDISALGVRTKSIITPAYRVLNSQQTPLYATMGPIASGVGNKNMLAQPAAKYSYLLDPNGAKVALLGAEITTWKNDWGYRDFDIPSSTFSDVASAPQTNAWRRQKNFIYKGVYSDMLNDGSLSLSTFTDFNFSGSNSSKWLQTSETTRYDHFSMPVESYDPVKLISSSTKMDFNNKYVFATASNANYFEFAYSGAEEGDNSLVFFGGEVAKANGSVISGVQGTDTHTGQYAIQLTAGNKSFVYNYPSVPSSSPLTVNRTFRVSVWTNSINGTIYYILDAGSGGTEQPVFPVSTLKAGNWYQINAEIPVTTLKSLEVGVKCPIGTSGTVNFDDFRFQPRDAALTGNVYDPVTGSLTFVLDNQNMFTQYEYNDQGQLIKTYTESFKYGKNQVSESKTNYRRTNIDQ